LLIDGDGAQSRDFTYVENVVLANRLAATAKGASGNVYNVACGERYSLLDIASALEDACGYPLERQHGPARAGDVRHSQADIGAARKDLEYEVSVGFAEGLAATWRVFYERFRASSGSL
jgi:UDP-glucose 4-epimerase